MIDPTDPVLDQPLIFEPDETASSASEQRFRLGNGDLLCTTDANADLHDLFWPWADEFYARRVTVRLSAPREDEFVPMTTRLFPGYQETIYGTEGIIVSKQLFAPYKSDYDRAVILLLQCQAEGDRLLRVDIDIDWGEPLEQRMVDGLLVAQNNPRAAQGIYAQKNADSTRVIGNPDGRPSEVEIEDPQRAHLVYYVLVNGMVEVPLILTVSDVGEQMAWNGFLALRDANRIFEKSNQAWSRALKTGRLWTPDPQFNRAVHYGKVATIHYLQRLRTGLAPLPRALSHVPALVQSLDTFDVVQSRNLLAHVRRVAERTSGRLPLLLPLSQQDRLLDPGIALPATNTAYLTSLCSHLRHHFDMELARRHYEAVKLSVEALIQYRVTQEASQREIYVGLLSALRLAKWMQDDVNGARWQSEVHAMTGSISEQDEPPAWRGLTTVELPAQAAQNGTFPHAQIEIVGRAIWSGCGLAWTDDAIVAQPHWLADWPWWALMDLPSATGPLSVVWDGQILHATQPVQSDLPVRVHKQILARDTDELNFALRFEFTAEDRQEEFRPKFDQGHSEK